MPYINWVELVGYCGSVLVTISLMMRSIIRLRWINLAGAFFFSVYGFIIDAYPVLGLNAVICIVDIYYILQMYYKKDYFEIFEIKNKENIFLRRFIEYYKQDISIFFQQEDLLDNKQPFIFFASRNLLPVGLFIGELIDHKTLQIKIDYVIPGYRDLKVARYVYRKRAGFFLEKGIEKLEIESTIPRHVAFLNKMGFKKDENHGEGWFYYKFR